MWWLAAVAGVYFFRGKIAQLVAPLLSDTKKVKGLEFYCHCVAVLAGVVYAVPLELVGLGMVKKLAWLSCMWASVLASLIFLGTEFGGPPMPDKFELKNWRQSMQEMQVKLQPWLQNSMMSVNFHFLFFSLIFLAASPTVFVVLILGRRSLWSVCTVCEKESRTRTLWLWFAPRWDKLKAQNAQIVEYSALAEVGLGLWLGISLLLPTRQILTCILYWQYLKMRYQVPKSQVYHLKAWQTIYSRVEPLFKAVPILNKPLNWAKGQFKPQYAPAPAR
jgi:hypothetical protein